MTELPATVEAALDLRLQAAMGADMAENFRDSVAENTWRAYKADLADYGAWCKSKRRSWSTPETVAAYFMFLEESGSTYATIGRRKTAIAKLVQAEQIVTGDLVEDPTKHPKVAITLQAIRRRIGVDNEQSTPLTGDRLIQVLLAIDADTKAGQRDIAIMLIGFYGAMRRSELAAMRQEHLQIDENGAGIKLVQSKTSQTKSVWAPIHRQPTSRWDPIAALETWLAATDGIEHGGGIWLRVTKGDSFFKSAKPISGDAMNEMVKRRVRAAGLKKADTYSAHSMRAGFVTEAKNRGIDEADIMRQSRHKSLQQMRSYDRTSGWWHRNATASLAL